jgi:hypothetical protein
MTVAYYVGTTGTGKTTLMCSMGLARAAERGVPAILIDSEGVVGRDKFDADGVRTLEELLDAVWRDGKHARYHPAGAADVARLCEVIRRGKDVVLLIDEISYWGRGASPVPELARLCRIHRHSRLDLFATSQYPGDISPLIWNIRSDTYVFRNDSLRALERLGEELRLTEDEEEAISQLPNLKYIHFQTGIIRNSGSTITDPPEAPAPSPPVPSKDAASPTPGAPVELPADPESSDPLPG